MKGLFFYTKPCSLPVVAGLVILLQACQTPSQKHFTAKQERAAVLSVEPAKPTPKQPDSLCIAAVGDIMLGTSYPNNATLPPDSAVNSFNAVKPDLKGANVIFGNLE